MKIRNRVFLTFCFIISGGIARGQVTEEYNNLVLKAFSLYDSGDYKGSALAYSDAFKSMGWKGFSDDRYNAACSWALAGNHDSAFYNLEKITVRLNYKNYNHITSDSDLVSLHNDSRWRPLLELIKKNKELAEVNLNRPLASSLDTVFESDQWGRKRIKEVEEKFGRDSKEMRELWAEIIHTDSLNLVTVITILDSIGWPGPDVAGEKGNSAVFLVIQHADLKTQEKYLPMMEEAVKKGNAKASSLALLVDRIEMRNERPQVYGSQIFIGSDGKPAIYKIRDEPLVNKRREAAGLPPLEQYVKMWGIDYKLPEK